MMKFGFTPQAERINTILATVGLVGALGAYALTGQIIPGVW